MDYEQQQKVTSLVAFIRQNKVETKLPIRFPEAIEADIVWEASRFWAEAIYSSESRNSPLTITEFLSFKQNYELKTNQTIDDDNLFNRFWLRNVLGVIKIPLAISTACHTYRRISNYKEELRFLLHLYNTRVGETEFSLDEAELEKAKLVYEAEHHVSLDKAGIYFQSWLSLKDGKVKISDMEVYFKPYLDHWNELAFISSLIEEKVQKERGLLISASIFVQLHKSFGNLYHKIPEIKELGQQKIITNLADQYVLNFSGENSQYWLSLNDKIAGYFWELLVDDLSIGTDEERIKIFLHKIVYWSGWPCFLNIVTDSSKRKFLNAAVNLVVNEPELKGIEKELQKVQLDNRNMNPWFCDGINITSVEDFSLDDSDLFELLESLLKWNQIGHSNLLYDQPTRYKLDFLISTIVSYDYETEWESIVDTNTRETYHYKRIKQLLRSSLDKPYLLWSTTRFIIKDRADVIPYLIFESDLMSLPAVLIDYVALKPGSDISRQLWTRTVTLLLENIPKSQDDYPVSARIIFQLFRQINKKKYEIPFNRGKPRSEVHLRSEMQRKETEVLALIENSLLYNHKVYGIPHEEYLLPVIFNHLIHLFTNFEIKEFYRNGTVQFPMLQWDGIIWLMKCSTYWKYKEQLKIAWIDNTGLSDIFLKLYLNRIEITEVSQFIYSESKIENGIPTWSEKIERLEYLDWVYPIYFINKTAKLGRFLSPNIQFETPNDLYNKKNQFATDKLRTHIGVLLQVLRKLVLPVIPYGFDRKVLNEIKTKIEQQIIDYLRNAFEDNANSNSGLFAFLKEWGYGASNKQALLPEIARAVNWFSNKDEVANIFTQSSDIEKILTLLDSVTSEGIKKSLIARIGQLNIRAFLESISIPESLSVIAKISQYSELILQIEEAVEYWEKRIAHINLIPDYQLQLYNTRLLLAYFKKDEKELSAVKEPPKNPVISTREFSSRDYKRFYSALIKLREQPEHAYRIFDSLCKQYPSTSILALNRMAAKINQANKDDDNPVMYREALEEWKEYEKNISAEDFATIELNLAINKLTILNKIGEYDEMEMPFEKLELPYRMLRSILEIRIEGLLAQKRWDEASMLLESAVVYHQFSDPSDVQFISYLKEKIAGIDNVNELQNHYNRILSSDPGKLIKILPNSLNGKIELEDFIVKEIIISTDGLLDKIESISEIKDEEKYNDVIELTLSARLNTWYWQVTGNQSGAYSDSDLKNGGGRKRSGERDLMIKDRNGVALMVCEAFIYRGITTARTHLFKIFNYHHKKNAFMVLIYDIGEQGNDFKKNWKDYREEILPKIQFPPGYELNGAILEADKEFGCSNSAIKVGVTNHGLTSKIYHLFVNINYRIARKQLSN